MMPSILIVVISISMGCGKTNSIQYDENSMAYPLDTSELALIPPSDGALPEFKFEPLSWESVKAGNLKWSNYAFNLIDKEEFAILDRATDVGTFCPKYSQLNRLQKINFWGALVSGMVRFESNYRPTSRMVESGLGNDAVTGRPVASEGLLQLSYADSKYRKFCRMNWTQDRYKSDSDPTKTIFDPYINLECGIKILSDQVNDHSKIVISSGAYWSVIKTGHSNSKIAEISTITKQLTFCK